VDQVIVRDAVVARKRRWTSPRLAPQERCGCAVCSDIPAESAKALLERGGSPQHLDDPEPSASLDKISWTARPSGLIPGDRPDVVASAQLGPPLHWSGV
jgi:hypothetical protein